MPQTALQAMSTPPPPQMPAGQAQPGSNGPPGQPAAGAAAAAAMPAPTHQQTVAALRHFTAVGRELETLLKDPDLGKSDVKSKMIDGMTRLVAGRFTPAKDAVTQLAGFPTRPYDQKQWVMQRMQEVLTARDAVLDHHGQAFAGQPPQQSTGNPDDHINDMASMMQAHYGQGQNA